MPLTDMKVRNVKPTLKPQKLSDGDALYLLVTPSGRKYWRFKYRYHDKEKVLALGIYPEVSLAEARERKAAARKQLANEVDPCAARKAEKAAWRAAAENTFEVVAREWFEKFKHTWSEGHAITITSRLENNVFPWIGSRPIADIEALEVLAVLRRVEARGALETALRIKTVCGQIFRYAIATGRAKRDVAADLRGALPQPIKRSLAAIIEPDMVKVLLVDSDNYQGTFVVRCALQLAPLVFLRPGELRHAEWAEFDLEKGEWHIPVERLKLKKREKVARHGDKHIVPLSSQALKILRELHPLTGRGRYVFPSARSTLRCMSENAVLAALRRMGYDKNTMTGHGFRAMARTILDEVLHVRPDYIEHQLTHMVKDPNGRAYNRTTFLPERRQMMQTWADYLDSLKGVAARLPAD